MIIKRIKNNYNYSKPKNNNLYSKIFFSYKSIRCILFLAFLILVYFLSKNLKTHGYSNSWDFAKTIISNYSNSIGANPEKISIEIRQKDFKFLEKTRETALERNLIINNIDGEFVPATLEYQGKKMQIKLRLKGHMTDHLQDNKWSFRIKVEDKNSFMGMKRFSIQHPGTRGYVYEWIYHELMKRENIITLRYKFINISINGRDWGIYAVEESFDKELLENNNRKKGPIIRFDPDLYWVDRYNEVLHKKPTAEFASYYSANLEVFEENEVINDSLQKNYYLKALALVDGLRNKKLSVDQVFDLERLAKFHAITDLVGGEHSLDWSDTKYYYNPVTGKLEPISYESFTDFPLREIAGTYKYVELDSSKENYDDWHTALFSNPVFFKEYVKNLERVSDKKYLDVFFKSINKELNSNLSILYKEFPYKKFDKESYYENQEIIHKILSPPQTFYSYFKHCLNNQISLQIGGIESLPVEIKSISIGNKNSLPLVPIILPSKQRNAAVTFKDYLFPIPTNMVWNDTLMHTLKINYSILGSSVTQQTNVFPFPHTDTEFIADDLHNRKGNESDFPFIKVDEATKSIILKEGKITLNKDLIIDKGYTVYGNPNLIIDLINHSKIISYSPFIFKGRDDEPITIESSDSTGQGFEFINAPKSIFENVIFKTLPKVNDNQWARSGYITFYESNVTFKDCNFFNSKSECALTLIRSNFTLKECSFGKMNNSALNVDYSEGEINNCAFENCNYNAIVIIKSVVKFKSIFVKGVNNNALSIEEGSQILGEDIRIKDSKIALSAEGLTNIDLKTLSITNSQFGIIAYKNKAGYGFPTINITKLDLSNVKQNYLKEAKAIISINNKAIIEEAYNIENILNDFNKKNK